MSPGTAVAAVDKSDVNWPPSVSPGTAVEAVEKSDVNWPPYVSPGTACEAVEKSFDSSFVSNGVRNNTVMCPTVALRSSRSRRRIRMGHQWPNAKSCVRGFRDNSFGQGAAEENA